jgi:hypothetical protein
VLSTALAGLAGIMLCLVLPLGRGVAGQAGEGRADGAGNAVTDAFGVVVDLALGLLLLSIEVLLTARLSESLFTLLVYIIQRVKFSGHKDKHLLRSQ